MAKLANGNGSVPSMQNVAAYAGVSIATVSKVMQGDPTVRAENVTAVQNAIEALGYRINPLASELRRGRRQLIGFILPCYDDLTTALIPLLERQAADRGYALWAASSDRSEQREGELISRFQDWRVAGLIVMPVANGTGTSSLLINETTATVLIECTEHVGRFDSVSSDLEVTAMGLLQRFVELGHDHIAILMPPGADAVPARLRNALVAASTSLPGLRMACPDLNSEIASNAEILGLLFETATRPTAVIAIGSEPLSTIAAYAAGRRWTVPSDLSYLAMTASTSIGVRPVDAIWYPIEALAARVMDTIARRLESPTLPVVSVKVPLTIRTGSTLGRPRLDPHRSAPGT